MGQIAIALSGRVDEQMEWIGELDNYNWDTIGLSPTITPLPAVT